MFEEVLGEEGGDASYVVHHMREPVLAAEFQHFRHQMLGCPTTGYRVDEHDGFSEERIDCKEFATRAC